MSYGAATDDHEQTTHPKTWGGPVELGFSRPHASVRFSLLISRSAITAHCHLQVT